MIAGFLNFPLEMASPILPRTPEDWMPAITPCLMSGSSASCAAPIEVAQMVISRMPIRATSCMTMLIT